MGVAESRWAVYCDDCDKLCQVHKSTKQEAIHAAMLLGWRTIGEGVGLKDICPDCLSKRKKKGQ